MFQVDYATHDELVRAYNGMAPFLGKVEISKKTHTHERCIDLVEAIMEELSPLGDLQITPKGEVSFIPNADLNLDTFKELDLEERYQGATDEGADGDPDFDDTPAPEVIENEPGMAAKARALHEERLARKGKRGGGANAKYKDSAVIRVVNPDAKKTGDALRRFKMFKDGMTVKQYLAQKDVSRRDIRRNLRKGYIKLEG